MLFLEDFSPQIVGMGFRVDKVRSHIDKGTSCPVKLSTMLTEESVAARGGEW